MKTLLTVLFGIFSLLHHTVAQEPLTIGTAADEPIGSFSIQAISIAPDQVLLIGDGRNRQILAVSVGGDVSLGEGFADVPNVRAMLAERMGVTRDEIEILDVAYEPLSKKLYVAVRKQDENLETIIRISQDGTAEPFLPDGLQWARIPIPDDGGAPVNRITDVIWAGDRLIAAARANEEFASRIFAAEGPLHHDRPGQMYSAETYHISHRRWETKAPMSVMIPFEEDGKHYVVGAFSCTPVVKYPIKSVKPGAKIKGISMLELGSGNRPLNMFSYESEDGTRRVLTNTFRFHHEKRPYGPSPHLAFQFDEDILSGDDRINEDAIHRLKEEGIEERVQIAEAFHGVVHMDRANNQEAIALRENGEGDFDLVTIPLR